MSWLEILKKNDKEFDKNIKLSEINQEEEDNINEIDSNIKDIEEEFDKIYLDKIVDIKLELKEYIDSDALPFLNKNNYTDNNFYNFIKYNSENYFKLEVEIEKENELYLESIEIEDNEIYDEYKDSIDY
jgi:hypothetical protein